MPKKFRTQWKPSKMLTSVPDPRRVFGLLTVGDISKSTGIRPATINYFQRKGLIHPVLVSKNRRKGLFSIGTAQTILNIQDLRNAGMSLQKIRRRLQKCYGLPFEE